MRVLVTGANGYIGSQTCKQLSKAGHTVVAVDRNPIKHSYCAKSVQRDYDIVGDVIREQKIEAVVHIGATSLVGPSMTDPATYYRNNVVSTQALMDFCVKKGVKHFVFASSAACYGSPADGVCKEQDTHIPMNPYGRSKRMTEIMLEDYARAYGLNSVSLRFFNVAGADVDGEMGQEKSATHLIARIIESGLENKTFELYGNDYNTKDGTCVRDYVHVEDIANGILKSLEYLNTNTGAHVINLGSKSGYSNLDIIRAVEWNTPLDIKWTESPRRAGDPDMLVAEVELANNLLGWKPQHDLDTIVKTAYNWYTKKTSTS